MSVCIIEMTIKFFQVKYFHSFRHTSLLLLTPAEFPSMLTCFQTILYYMTNCCFMSIYVVNAHVSWFWLLSRGACSLAKWMKVTVSCSDLCLLLIVCCQRYVFKTPVTFEESHVHCIVFRQRDPINHMLFSNENYSISCDSKDYPFAMW